MDSSVETNLTEIELTTDGRICVFGASREVLALLDQLQLGDEQLRQRLRYLEGHESDLSSNTKQETTER